MKTLQLRLCIPYLLHTLKAALEMQITIHSDHAEYPDLKLTTFGTRKIFERLREV
jgi:hypothetical protein